MAEQSNPGLKALITGAVLGVASAALGGYTMFADKTPEAETTISAGKSDSALTAEADAVKQTQFSLPSGASAVLNARTRGAGALCGRFLSLYLGLNP